MKRKLSDVNEEETKLSKLLFKKTENLVERLKNDAYEEEDLDKKPAWVDEDDEQFSANIIPDVKSKGLYTEKLKQKYETLMGTPNWAKLTKKAKAEDDEDEDDSEILRTVGHIKNNKSKLLQKGVLGIKNFPKINKSTGTEGKVITSVEFHPKMSVSMVSGTSGIVSLFSIGGDTNNKLHSFRIKYNGRGTQTSRAHFTPDGNKAYVASKFTHDFCEYDLVKAEPKLVALPPVIKSAQIFELSPDGKYFAISDGQDELYITSTISKELVRTLKHNSNLVSVVFGSEGDKLICYCEGGEVTIWDLSTYRSLKKFYDNGCVTASSINISPCGRLLATGSGEGIVNIYEADSLTATEPRPIKTISSLTTKITDLKFNATTEILSVSSSFYPNAIKLVHIPSYHVYMNFPKSELNQIECMNFSPNSGYMALGNNKSSAYLYRLTHYKNY